MPEPFPASPRNPQEALPVSGAALRALRLGAGLSQEGLARRAGVALATVHRLEAGKHRAARTPTLEALADALGVGVERLRLNGRKAHGPGARGY